MPWRLVGFDESQDSATLVNVATLADGQHITQSGDDLTVPKDSPMLVAAYALGPNLTQVQIRAPSLRGMFNLDLEPEDLAAEPTSRPPVHDFRRSPIALVPSEFLTVQASEDAAGASRATVLAWLADGPIEPLQSAEIRTVRVTNTTTLTANAWSNGGLTFSQELPAGRYQVVGARFQSAGLQAFRLVFRGGFSFRPGGIGFDADSDVEPELFRRGGMGVWGEFDHREPPTVDFLSNSADTSQVGHLDLIKVA